MPRVPYRHRTPCLTGPSWHSLMTDLALVHGDSKCQDERKLFAVYIYIFQHHELTPYPLECSYSVKLDGNVVETNVPIAPFTSPLLVSMFRRSMTREQPRGQPSNCSQCSIFSSRLLVHLNFPVISSTSSMHGISFVSAFNLESISVLNS